MVSWLDFVWVIPVCFVGTLVPLVLGVVVLSVGFNIWRGRRAMAVAMAAVARPTYAPQWAAGAYGLWTGGEDCGQWPREQARDALRNWYGVEDAAGFWGTIRDLQDGQTGNAAWDQVRALDLLRIGTAAGYISDAECWSTVADIADDLRGRYRSWEELGAGFEAGMLAWQDGRGITDETARGRVKRNLPVLRGQYWLAVPYEAPLR